MESTSIIQKTFRHQFNVDECKAYDGLVLNDYIHHIAFS